MNSRAEVVLCSTTNTMQNKFSLTVIMASAKTTANNSVKRDTLE